MYSLSSNPYASNIANLTTLFAFVHNTLLFLFHTYHLIKHKMEYSTIPKLYWLSSITLLMLSIHRIGVVSISYGFWPHYVGCKMFYDIITSTWLVTRTALYSLFIERLFAVFANSLYSFSQRSIWFSRIFLLSQFSFMCPLTFMVGQSYLHDGMTCEASYPLWYAALVFILDIAIGITICIIFTRRLTLLAASCPEKVHTVHNSGTITSKPSTPQMERRASTLAVMKGDQVTFEVFSKFTLLTILAMITTFIAIVLFFICQLVRLWMSIDAIINSWCIVLMFSYNKRIYMCLCSQMEKVIRSEYFLICVGINCCCCEISDDLTTIVLSNNNKKTSSGAVQIMINENNNDTEGNKSNNKIVNSKQQLPKLPVILESVNVNAAPTKMFVE